MLPRWRYILREQLIPIVRWETPYVAWLQSTLRSPALDTYFAMSANLGTHTFFNIMLPIWFWCGYTDLGRGMTHILAMGVFFSGFIKDLVCLPRPLSPPLQRITMSGSAALEYGFPSTHSTNAVSVAVYAILLLRENSAELSPNMSLAIQVLAYFYACSIILGRLYCGMHGFFDVVFGSALGAALGLLQFAYGPVFDEWFFAGNMKRVLLVILSILVLVRIHPEPADDCPCFDDSVAFAAVVIGVEFGTWHFAKSPHSWSYPSHGTVPFDLEQMGWFVAVARILLGVVVVFAWRGVMKPLLLKSLPPLFRIIEQLGLSLPRRFFKPASQYKTVPRQRHDDNVIPYARDIPELISSLRRRRAVSIGPQSEADAYETLAYREKRRRDSLTANGSPNSPKGISPERGYVGDQTTDGHVSQSVGRNRSSSLEMFRAQMGTGMDSLSPQPVRSPPEVDGKGTSDMDELQAKSLFSSIQRPRVRYDVEVVTKLIVYSGIAWWSVEGNPLLFKYIGLGME
ncbi:hypothetical protein, variant 1 [Exophiala mesophila]|nr:hypothetical protein, variant 1 [Exophiala mesophila]KIV91097.1 hypothetical protein, variant 1 [Exophiala mesophila]